MKLPSSLMLLFTVATMSSAHAAPEAAARGERSRFAPGSEVVFELESEQDAGARSGQSIRAAPPEQGRVHDDTLDGDLNGSTIRTGANRGPEPAFLQMIP